MMRYLVPVCLATTFSLQIADAQTQTTMGPCSPAINGVAGNASVTCITTDHRIRVAKFTGDLDSDKGKSFGLFIDANSEKIVSINSETDGLDGLYEDQKSLGLNDIYEGHLKIKSDPGCTEPACEGIIVYFNDLNKKSTAFWHHGNWAFQGYFYVGCGGWSMGWTEYCLRPVDGQELALSPKYDIN